MKRDLDLAREILLLLEKGGPYTNWFDVDNEAYSPEQIDYHLELLVEAGLIRMKPQEQRSRQGLPIRLTWAGHEFLDLARDETNWREVQGSMGRSGSVPFEALRSTLLALTVGERQETITDAQNAV